MKLQKLQHKAWVFYKPHSYSLMGTINSKLKYFICHKLDTDQKKKILSSYFVL